MTSLKDVALLAWRKAASPALRPILARITSNGSLRWHRAEVAPGPFTGYCVYRAKNEEHVRSIVESAPGGSSFHFHALDEVPDSLKQYTRSRGTGARMPLLNGLVAKHQPQAGQPVAIFDDDVTFVRDSVGLFVGLAQAADLDLAQPGHAIGSFASYRTNRIDPPSTVRLVRYIEAGPFVLMSPSAALRLIPFPDDLAMGWGVDVWWSALHEPPMRLGIVDATPMRHHGAVGVEYPNAEEQAILDRYLSLAGIRSAHDLDRNVGLTWRPWQTDPKWR